MKPEGSMCAWCGTVLQPKETALIVKARTVMSVPEFEGVFVPFKLAKSGRTITGFFVASGSPVKRKGIDVIFAACSQECAAALKAAIQEEADDLKPITG
jgi:hypothetical protein